MANYIIRVDSSTKGSKLFITDESGRHAKTIKSGESAAAWITQKDNSIIASGLIYYHYNGPNKTVYEGILAALSQLETQHFYIGGTDKVKIFTDCKIVIDQLNGAPSTKMAKHLELVKAFCNRHQNVKFEFSYQNEENPEFKKVDQLSKVGKPWIKKMILKPLKLKPKEVVKKPYFKGNPMVWSEARKKWYIINKNDEWFEFSGKEENIEWRIAK